MALSGGVSPAGGLNFPAVGKGVAVTVILTILAGLFAGIVFHYSSASETFLPWVSVGILLISVLAGSVLAVKQAGRKGLLHGAGVGLVSFVLLWVTALVILPGPLVVIGLLQKLLILVGGGALGGMLGVAVS